MLAVQAAGFGELSVLQSLGTIMNTLKYPKDNGIPTALQIPIELAKSSLTGFIPGPIRQTAQALDPFYRETYNSTDAVQQSIDAAKNGIPGARETLPTKISSYGQERQQTVDDTLRWANAFFMPGSITRYKPNRNTENIDALVEKTGKSLYPAKSAPYSVNFTENGVPQVFDLDAEARRRYQQAYGQAVDELYYSLWDNENFRAMDASAQAEMLEQCRKLAKYNASKAEWSAQGATHTSAADENLNKALKAGFNLADWATQKTQVDAIKAPSENTEESRQLVVDYIWSVAKSEEQAEMLYLSRYKDSTLGKLYSYRRETK